MSRVMKWVDSSISVTYLLPENSDWKDVYKFILEANKKEVKSIAAFPDKKMYGIVSFIPFKDLAIKLTKEGEKIKEENFSKDEIEELEKTFNINLLPEGKIQKTNAPKRPKVLDCDIHHIKITKKLDKVRTFDYLVLVGLFGEDPYECFIIENGNNLINKKVKKGSLTKEKRGTYNLKCEDGTELKDITKETSESEDIFMRMTSVSLRHGADIAYIISSLEKSEGSMWSLAKAVARALKTYIKNGTKITGDSCSQCGGNNLIRVEGCKTCPDCGNAKCG